MKTLTKIRKILTLISLLVFPLTLNFFSPYVSVDGAFNGILSGSVLLFITMLLTGLVFRRSWCSYICPVAALSEFGESINSKTVNRKRLGILRYSIFAIWFSVLILGFVLAGGIKSIQPLYLTETGISVDMPIKYITYYMVLGILVLLTLTVGKRGACQSICWMSPFLVAGSWLGEKLHLPQYQVVSKPQKCIHCSQCNKVCPMSIDVMKEQETGRVGSFDCIDCGRCSGVCPKNVLDLKFHKVVTGK